MRGIAVLWVIAFHYGALGDAARDPWLAAINAVVHQDTKPKDAFDLFNALKAKG